MENFSSRERIGEWGETLLSEEERREKRRVEISPPLTHARACAGERGREREGRGGERGFLSFFLYLRINVIKYY